MAACCSTWLTGRSRGTWLRAASAMAFDLFLALIPLLALAGWMFGRVIQGGGAVLAVSLLLDTTPDVVHSLAERQLMQLSPSAFAPVALLGSWWLSSSAAATCMALIESRGWARPRPWWRRRAVALAAVLAGIVVFGAGSALALWLIGGPVTLLETLVNDRVAARTGYLLALAMVHLLVMALLAMFFRILAGDEGARALDDADVEVEIRAQDAMAEEPGFPDLLQGHRHVPTARGYSIRT